MKNPKIKLFAEAPDQYFALHEGVRPVTPDDATPPGSIINRNLPVMLHKDFAKHCDIIERAKATVLDWVSGSKLWMAFYNHVSSAKPGKCAIDISNGAGRTVWPHLCDARIWKEYTQKGTDGQTEVKLSLRLDVSLSEINKGEDICFPYEMFANFNQKVFDKWCKERAAKIEKDLKHSEAYRQIEKILHSGVLSPATVGDLVKEYQREREDHGQ